MPWVLKVDNQASRVVKRYNLMFNPKERVWDKL